MNKEQVTQRLEDIIETINTAQADINNEIVKDLSNMDVEVAKICEDIVKLPQDDAASIQPMMADMISRLEALAQSLQDFKSQYGQSD